MVYIAIYAIHHNVDHFPDSEPFKPERLLPDQEIVSVLLWMVSFIV